MGEVIGTLKHTDGSEYQAKLYNFQLNFKLSTDLLKAKKSWNDLIDTIHNKGGKAISNDSTYLNAYVTLTTSLNRAENTKRKRNTKA